jgi:hypothetical protein
VTVGVGSAHAAWRVDTTSAGQPSCPIGDTTKMVGNISDTAVQASVWTVPDGSSVMCSVLPLDGGGAFVVDGTATLGVDMLQIHVPSMTATATAASPAIGSVLYQSDATVVPFRSDACHFYFENSTQGIAVDHVWVAFDCPAIEDSPSMSVCTLSKGLADFEGCSSGFR